MDLSISQLVKKFGAAVAIKDLTLHIRGGMFGLLGPNGAGKTTLMRLLTTQILPTSGELKVGGLDVVRKPEAVRRCLGYLPQEFGFYRGLKAYEMLDYIGSLKNLTASERKQEIELVLHQVNLTQDAGKRVETFSGGMKQRLGIAQALLGNPQVLIVDEPTAGLDPEERIRFRNLLSRLSHDRTVLLSTHIVADVAASCSEIAVLVKGRLQFAGSPAELAQVANGKVWRVEVSADEWSDLDGDSNFTVVTSRSVNGCTQLVVLGDENPLGRGVPQEASLEEGYLALVGRKGREMYA
ncbi:MAG: ABC transporter ATP-binding protein [Bacillota bacterium]